MQFQDFKGVLSLIVLVILIITLINFCIYMEKTTKPFVKAKKKLIKERFPNLTNKELKSRNFSITKYELNNFFSRKQRIIIRIYGAILILSFILMIFGLITQKSILEALFAVVFFYLLALLFKLVRLIDNDRLAFWDEYLLSTPDNPLKIVMLDDDSKAKVNAIRKQFTRYFFVFGSLCFFLLFLV